METYNIIVLPSAHADLSAIVDYLNKLSPTVAVSHSSAIIDAIDSLAILPNRCPPARDEALAEKGYRYMIVKNWLIFYTVTGQTVRINRILDGRSNYIGTV